MKKWQVFFLGLGIGAFTMFLAYQTPRNSSLLVSGAQQNAVSSYLVTHIVDGDTIDVRFNASKTERIRLLGIDTPETVDHRKKVQCYGPQASKRLHELLSGKTVELLVNPAEDKDAYGRLLRYVSLDGIDINAKMLQEGYAESLCKRFPHPRCVEYDALQKEAQTGKKGRWGACL